MKIIVLCAGKGSRFNINKPKCLINVFGKSLIKRCINLLKIENGIGQAGGITLNKESAIKDYLDYVIGEHKKRNPSLKVIDTYVGFKKELVQKGQERNYLLKCLIGLKLRKKVYILLQHSVVKDVFTHKFGL